MMILGKYVMYILYICHCHIAKHSSSIF